MNKLTKKFFIQYIPVRVVEASLLSTYESEIHPNWLNKFTYFNYFSDNYVTCMQHVSLATKYKRFDTIFTYIRTARQWQKAKKISNYYLKAKDVKIWYLKAFGLRPAMCGMHSTSLVWSMCNRLYVFSVIGSKRPIPPSRVPEEQQCLIKR